MNVIYTKTHFVELESRLASKHDDFGCVCSYIGLGCLMISCTRPGC